MASATFWVIRAKKTWDLDNVLTTNKPNHSHRYYFKQGWYASREYMDPDFSKAKFFGSQMLAKKYIRSSSTLGCWDEDRNDYLEIVPVTVQEPK